MGFLAPDGSLLPPPAAPAPLAAPPVLLDWSGSNDHWSRNHERLWEGMRARKMSLVGLWGGYGHNGDLAKGREKNDLVGSFDVFSVRRDQPYRRHVQYGNSKTGISLKCESEERSAAPLQMADAAIQTSLVGRGFPRP